MRCNLGTADRVVRGIAGAGMIAAGLIFAHGAATVLIALLGAVLIFSGTVGFCHVFKVLHLSSRKDR